MLSSYHIIIVDDEASVRALLARIVERTYPLARISLAADSAAALLRYQQAGADLLITDNDMPDQSGLDLVCMLRAQQVTIPIVMVSGDASMAREARDAGVTRFVVKPFRVAHLTEILTNLLPAVRAASA